MHLESNNGRSDRHRSGFRLRLPEIFRTKLRLLGRRTGEPMTLLVQAALRGFLQRAGLWTRKDDEQLRREAQPALGSDPLI